MPVCLGAAPPNSLDLPPRVNPPNPDTQPQPTKPVPVDEACPSLGGMAAGEGWGGGGAWGLIQGLAIDPTAGPEPIAW